MQALLDAILGALREAWRCDARVHRGSPIVSIADNYDRLHYPPEGAARAARYTRYVCETALLRTHLSAEIPRLLRGQAHAPGEDVLLACPGLAYRRDCIDRLHSAEPHQLDLWRVRRGPALGERELHAMIGAVVDAALPGREWRSMPTEHPYTVGGLQIDVRDGDEWIEIGECGLALPALLHECGLATPPWSGLAMGLGLDRLLMLRKGVPDIRLLRSQDPRVSAQMLDLAPYRAVSAMPAVTRDLSIAVAVDADAEALGDQVRSALGERASLVERVEVLSETPYAALPVAARERIGIAPEQKNVLVRVVLRALERTLTADECNRLRDEVYAATHRGARWQWASR
jgi:phenylalanyl-tRNA synthetase alpha chain